MKKRKVPRSVLMFALAVVLGVAAVFMVQTQISRAQDTVKVVQAKASVPPFGQLTKDNLQLADIPKGAVPADAITSLDKAAGQFVSTGLVAGDIVRQSELIKQGDRISVQLAMQSPDSVAMVIPVSADQGAQLPKAGDVIDLLGVQQTQGGVIAQTFPAVHVIKVLDPNATSNNSDSSSSSSSSSTDDKLRLVVEVSAQDEQKIAEFLAVGDLRLAVRPIGAKQSAVALPQTQQMQQAVSQQASIQLQQQHQQVTQQKAPVPQQQKKTGSVEHQQYVIQKSTGK